MQIDAVTASYRRWAPIYDNTFGRVTQAGRRRGAAYLSRLGGRLLEVGVGTGLSLPLYDGPVRVTGIDYSAEMLAKAEARAAAEKLSHVEALRQMDARQLDLPDESFDAVAAMHVLSVVPEPERVMTEIARVCRPGGKVVVVNHFTAEGGALRTVEKIASPLENLLGWESDFPMARILGDPRLQIDERDRLPPFGMMTWLVLTRV